MDDQINLIERENIIIKDFILQFRNLNPRNDDYI